ncbi:acyltransferase family protein [Bradyrhizobium sp. SZCCHNR2026]|uniref:acyltransferase family protein n=1 Tax=Bradyrhizobium sp. SZCCHNR2026 TaxID=3057381 RepID=UPI002915F63A|nr:acyltransferase family protein [Bradyrhizobium sp. SZCCHNR2026]
MTDLRSPGDYDGTAAGAQHQPLVLAIDGGRSTMHGTDRRSVSDFGFAADHAIGYRADIDGLRAIAVLSVVTFHAFPNALRSGFVGVDIFFVISGYLITSIILTDLAAERFTLANFYARRIRRIFPALIVVLSFCLIAGAFLLLPDDFARLGKHTAAGAGFIANLAFWQEANYFDVASDSKVLLHLWSLGVEEQFYLVWPALMLLAWRGRLNRFLLIGAILAISLAYSVKATSTDPVAAFYSPVSRLWELAAGASLANLTLFAPRAAVWIERIMAKVLVTIFFERDADPDRAYRHVLSTLGMTLVLASTVVITRRHEFPGWWALMPVTGTYLLILAGPSAWLNRWVLSNQLLVWFGLISYPLYLWHWPLLTFARIHYGSVPPPPQFVAALVAASVALAWLTYRYVEKPVRFGFKARRTVIAALVTAMIAIGAFGVADVASNGFPGRMSDEVTAWTSYFSSSSPVIQAEHKFVGQDQCNFYNVDSKIPTIAPRKAIDPSCYTKHSEKSVLILGDSNAADLYYGLKQVLPNDISVLMIYSSGCAPAPIHETALLTNHCEFANHFALERIKADPPGIILMSSNNSYDIDYIRQFTSLVKSYGVKHVLVLGQRPHWKPFLWQIVLTEYWRSTPRYIPGHQDEDLLSFGRKFQAQLRPDEPFEYVDEMAPFCKAEGCLVYLGENKREGLVTADTVHLRPATSVWLARQQLAPLILKNL